MWMIITMIANVTAAVTVAGSDSGDPSPKLLRVKINHKAFECERKKRFKNHLRGATADDWILVPTLVGSSRLWNLKCPARATHSHSQFSRVELLDHER